MGENTDAVRAMPLTSSENSLKNYNDVGQLPFLRMNETKLDNNSFEAYVLTSGMHLSSRGSMQISISIYAHSDNDTPPETRRNPGQAGSTSNHLDGLVRSAHKYTFFIIRPGLNVFTSSCESCVIQQ